MITDFDEIDRKIEDLQARVESCRQAMLLSRLAIAGAGAVLVIFLTLASSFRTPTVVFAAVAAALGGTVWLGASKASLQNAEDELTALDSVKNRMIDKVAVANGWRDLTPTMH